VAFDPKMNEYSITYAVPGGNGFALLRYCPGCGGKAPASVRQSLFARLTNAEVHRLQELTAGIKTVADAFNVLGAPDDDCPVGAGQVSAYRDDEPQVAEFFRTLVYRRLSETADVHVTVRSDHDLRITYQGKYIGPPGPSEDDRDRGA
jgi:hypothetical protein